MKRLFCLLLSLNCVAFVAAQTKAARESSGLNGPVRRVRLEEAEVANVAGQLRETAKVLLSDVTYDEKGNVTEQISYKPDGSREQKLGWGHTYDNKGRETETLYFNAEGVLTNKGVSVYDDKGRKTEKTQYNPDSSINHIQAYFYDDKEHKTRESHRNADGSARNNIIRTYDQRGNLIEEAFYDGQSVFIHRSVYRYDDHDKQIAWTVYEQNGTVVPMYSKSQSYNAQGQVIEVTYYRGDQTVESKETFTYEYDAHQNWIKKSTAREVFKAGVAQLEAEVAYRTITYF